VAVTVDGGQIFRFGLAMISIGVMSFNRVLHVEVKTTLNTFAFLPLNGG
jgi:hypothetical protein